jgi:CheY-like chemotaxis protein
MSELTYTMKVQIDEWLRTADRLIREGRYISADELLQKVFRTDPHNEIAYSYQDRIQFLIKQLSHRVGLNNEIRSEIQKYHTIHLERKNNQINTLMISAQKMLDDGYLKKAGELASKALALDSDHVYVKTFVQRVTELQRESGIPDHDAEHGHKFRSILKEAWREGKPSEAQETLLRKIQTDLTVTDERRQEIEREARNALYKEAINALWLTGGISAFTPGIAENLREKFSVGRLDYSLIEASLIREVRNNRIKGSLLIIDDNEGALLETSTVFRSHGYAVIAAATFDEVLACLKSFTPDVVLSEMNFQAGPIGFEIFELIRNTRATQHAAFFFISSSIDRSTLLIGKRLGVDDFITKPIDYELLLASISGHLAALRQKKV